MELNYFLKKYFNQLSSKNICEKNNFEDYNNFKDFIINHYKLSHIEIFNYIKYVKIKRQIIKIKDENKYDKLISNINNLIKIMSESNTFPNIDIRRYLCRINVFFELIVSKRKSLLSAVINIRSLFDKNEDYNFKIKIMNSVNSIIYRYKIFEKNSKKLVNQLNKLIELESLYEIDHNLIKLSNMERSILGKKSEYTANKIIIEYINTINKTHKNRTYYYETNINFLKFLNINAFHEFNIKGEVDGMIIYFDGNDYIIDKIIEVKSSIRSTFEDIKKFIFLQKYINNLNFDKDLTYEKYTFTKKSFINIIDKHLTEWSVYICINNIYKDVIERSHLYFSNVLKILDDNFIEEYYINNNEESIKNKFKIIIKNKELINTLFEKWKKDIMLDTCNCNIFISKIL